MPKHAVLEAKRLGIEIKLNNSTGYRGSGSPWVRPEQGMQWVYQSEQHVKRGARWQGTPSIFPHNLSDTLKLFLQLGEVCQKGVSRDAVQM
jgi:hypothetical protein